MDAEDRLIVGFGYKPQFKRVLGLFGDFSLGYSYMSPLAGFYALFAYALTTAGPAYFWTIPVILFGQILVALVLAEAASQYPIAGGVATAHIHVGFELILYIIEGKVRHEFGPGLKQVLENEAGDFIYIKPGVPHEVFNMSDTEPVVAFVARSSAAEWDDIIPYDRNQPA